MAKSINSWRNAGYGVHYRALEDGTFLVKASIEMPRYGTFDELMTALQKASETLTEVDYELNVVSDYGDEYASLEVTGARPANEEELKRIHKFLEGEEISRRNQEIRERSEYERLKKKFED